jgi:hypothetical protein
VLVNCATDFGNALGWDSLFWIAAWSCAGLWFEFALWVFNGENRLSLTSRALRLKTFLMGAEVDWNFSGHSTNLQERELLVVEYFWEFIVFVF